MVRRHLEAVKVMEQAAGAFNPIWRASLRLPSQAMRPAVMLDRTVVESSVEDAQRG